MFCFGVRVNFHTQKSFRYDTVFELKLSVGGCDGAFCCEFVPVVKCLYYLLAFMTNMNILEHKHVSNM